MAKNVLEFNEGNWEQEVVGAGQPVVVDFWAPWCGPCRMLTPVIESLAEKFAGQAKVGKVNVDDNQELAAKYNITTIPRVLVFNGSDQPLDQVIGVVSEAKLGDMINRAMTR